MIDRLSSAISVGLHLAIIVLLARITFAVERANPRKTGMEIEIVDLEYAMPNARPAVAERPSASASEPEHEPRRRAQTALEASAPAAPQPSPVAPPRPTMPDPAPESSTLEPKPAPVPVPTPLPKAETPPRAASAASPAQAPDKLGSAPRLDATALSRSRSIGTAKPAPQTRLNSATVGSAIGKAAPRGLPGLTFRQKVDLAQKVREQVMPCWNPPVGSEVGPASVRLRFKLDREGRVISQPIQSGVTGQSEANATYVNLLTNSGRRAILMCGPLDLPPELYEAWAEVEVEFDPGDLP